MGQGEGSNKATITGVRKGDKEREKSEGVREGMRRGYGRNGKALV